MTSQNKEVDKLLEVVAALDKDRVSLSDFVEVFDAIIKIVQEIKDMNSKEMAQIRAICESFISDLKISSKEKLSDITQSVSLLETDLKKKVARALDEQVNGMNFIRDKVRKIKEGKDGKDGKDAKPEDVVPLVLAKLPKIQTNTPIEIRNKLESLEGEERLDAKAIKNLDLILKRISALENRPVSAGFVGGRDLITERDISSQLDGVTKTFNIEAVYKILTVDLSSFPNALRKNVDYTYTQTTITFTSEIDAATSLASGQTCIITAVIP